jgi:hypothetical protein
MISEMDFVKGIKEIEERHGTYSKSTKDLIKKNLDKSNIKPSEWDELIPYILGRQQKKPVVKDFPDALSDIRGEGRRKGGGPQPPQANSIECLRCKGTGLLYFRIHRTVILCGCDNSQRPLFFMIHFYDHGKECYVRHTGRLGRQPPTLVDMKAEGFGLEHFEDIERCPLHETREDQRRRNWEWIQKAYHAGKYLPLPILKQIEGPDAKPRPMPKIGHEVPVPMDLDLWKEKQKLVKEEIEKNAPF